MADQHDCLCVEKSNMAAFDSKLLRLASQEELTLFLFRMKYNHEQTLARIIFGGVYWVRIFLVSLQNKDRVWQRFDTENYSRSTPHKKLPLSRTNERQDSCFSFKHPLVKFLTCSIASFGICCPSNCLHLKNCYRKKSCIAERDAL